MPEREWVEKVGELRRRAKGGCRRTGLRDC